MIERRKSKEKMEGKEKPKSQFISFCITAVVCILMIAVCFTFIIFKTDALISVNTQDRSVMSQIPRRVTTEYAVREAEKHINTEPNTVLGGLGTSSSNPNLPGITPGKIELSLEGREVLDKLNGSAFDAKKQALAACWDACHELCEGTNINADAFAIGLMANLASEGNYGLVEGAFSSVHLFGFTLPSGGKYMKTIADIDYCYNWPIDTTRRQEYNGINYKDGSCGVGTIQWSFGRRRAMLDVARKYMTTDADVTTENWMLVEIEYMKQELNVKGSYMVNIIKYINNHGSNESDASPELWAAALQTVYEAPWNSDTSAREAVATQIYNLLR